LSREFHFLGRSQKWHLADFAEIEADVSVWGFHDLG
jgi:hypothetical protein